MRLNFKTFLGRHINDVESLELFKLLKDDLPKPTTEGPWIAGGSIRRTISNDLLSSDIDYFFASASQRQQVESFLSQRGWKISSNEHVSTYGIRVGKDTYVIQCVSIAYYQNIESVIDSFDFTITQFAYDGEDLVCGDCCLWDLSRKRLVLHKLTFGVSTVRRMIKYTKQGFTACAGVLTKILEAVADNPDVIQSSTKYVD